MEQYLTQFLEAQRSNKGYSDNTIAAYRNDLTQLADFVRVRVGTTTDLAAITPQVVGDFVDSLQSGPTTYALSTVARKVAAVKSFFHFLTELKVIAIDPALRVSSPKVKKHVPRILTLPEIEQLLAAPARAGGPKAVRDAAMLAVLYATGLRVTEVVNLQLSDLNWEEGAVICRGRGERQRLIPLGAARGILEEYLRQARPALAREASPPTLFLNHRGQKLTRQGVWLIIKETAELAGLEGEVTPHTLRHSFAKHLLGAGESMRRVQELLGHANLSTTQAYQQIPDGPLSPPAAHPEG